MMKIAILMLAFLGACLSEPESNASSEVESLAAEPATVCHTTTDCYWYAPEDQAKQNQVCDRACGAPATCQRTATGGKCVQLTGEAAVPTDDRLRAVQELATEYVAEGLEKPEALAKAQADVAIPRELQLQPIGDGGAIVNTVCPLYATIDCTTWLGDQYSRNRLCTAGCGGPAVCAMTYVYTYMCGELSGDLTHCELPNGNPGWTTPYASDCTQPTRGNPGCVYAIVYDQQGRCQRSSGEP